MTEEKQEIKEAEVVEEQQQPSKEETLKVLGNQIGQIKVQLFDLNNEIKQKQSIYNQGMQQLQKMIDEFNKLKKGE